MKVLMIQRAEQFSPNSVEKDRAILDAVGDRLRQRGCDVETVGETSLPSRSSTVQPDVIFTMGRLPETLDWLEGREGVRIINAPAGIANCARCRLQAIMEAEAIPVPPREGSDGYWLKRGDAAAQSAGDVVFAANAEELAAAIDAMKARGIASYTVSAHIKGDLVKFYGVRGDGFFRYYYPTDDGQTKFDDERRNGPARHYPFDAEALQQVADRLARAVGIEVYGGDCIVRSDGSFCIIDFNDWPSFSRCRNEAAEAIVRRLNIED